MADFTDDAIIFKNFITPLRVGDSVPIICKYPRHKNVTLPYKIAQRSVRFYEKGLGSLEMVMRQFSSSGYQTEIQASSYPIFINSEEPVYLEVRVTGSMSDGLAVFPTKCLASASASPTNDTNAREIIKDGCKTDTSVVIYPSSAGKLRFRFNAFSLTPKSSVTYVHCEMLVCSVLDRSSKCHNDCSGSGDTMRAKRSLQATAEHNGHFVSSGPLFLDNNQSGTGSSLVAVFGVVAVVSMVVSVVAVAVATVTERRRRTKSRDIN
ncbi:ZP domain-containing protein-like [Liolophura sinensis]|uniref:ZP domain-containing protein-like n=1 Tax=Liolophura sinensis TaxID=3198878 RepID=UPI0031580AAF